MRPAGLPVAFTCAANLGLLCLGRRQLYCYGSRLFTFVCSALRGGLLHTVAGLGNEDISGPYATASDGCEPLGRLCGLAVDEVRGQLVVLHIVARSNAPHQRGRERRWWNDGKLASRPPLHALVRCG